MKIYYTYIVTNRKHGVLYTGMTNNVNRRTIQHKQKLMKGFTSRYNLDKLVWFQEFEWVQDAIAREKQIKGWRREKKISLIEEMNPAWNDLFFKIHPRRK